MLDMCQLVSTSWMPKTAFCPASLSRSDTSVPIGVPPESTQIQLCPSSDNSATILLFPKKDIILFFSKWRGRPLVKSNRANPIALCEIQVTCGDNVEKDSTEEQSPLRHRYKSSSDSFQAGCCAFSASFRQQGPPRQESWLQIYLLYHEILSGLFMVVAAIPFWEKSLCFSQNFSQLL